MKFWKYILFYGSLWGLAEALLGGLIHALPQACLISWIIIPIGYFCLLRTWEKTGTTKALIACGILAAAFKLSSLLFIRPELLIIVLKPTVCILIESLIAAAATAAISIFKPAKV